MAAINLMPGIAADFFVCTLIQFNIDRTYQYFEGMKCYISTIKFYISRILHICSTNIIKH